MEKITKNRIARVRADMDKNGIDTLLVITEENRRYLSDFTGEDHQFDESAGALLINKQELILATDSRFDLQASEEAPLYEIKCYREGLVKALPDYLRQLKTIRLGFETVRLSHKIYKDIEEILAKEKLQVMLVPMENLVEQIREVKDENEIEKTRDALLLAEKSFERLLELIRPGMTERNIAWLLEKEMRESGAEALAFPIIVASGPNSAQPHAIPSDRCWLKGEPLLFDWGARLGGYCSDISRTLVAGQPNDMFQSVYGTVRTAQKKAIEAIRDGASSMAVDKIARDHIENNGFKGKFGHSLGHGTGLAVHEGPRLSPLRDCILKAGQLVTVEPGIYIPGWGGIRIENQVVVREKEAEVLNRLDEKIVL